jgi:hypothetical protein
VHNSTQAVKITNNRFILTSYPWIAPPDFTGWRYTAADYIVQTVRLGQVAGQLAARSFQPPHMVSFFRVVGSDPCNAGTVLKLSFFSTFAIKPTVLAFTGTGKAPAPAGV